MGEDRISNLPLEIKISILSQCSLKDAVRTSVLARSWHLVWTHLPCLRLDLTQDPLGRYNPLLDYYADWLWRVNSFLLSFQGPLNVFQLTYSLGNVDFFDPTLYHRRLILESICDLLIQKGDLQTLVLYHPGELHLPFFEMLRVLELAYCHVFLPDGFQGFQHLRTLRMLGVGMQKDDLNLLLQTSRNLTSLKIVNCVALGPLRLSINLNLPLLRDLQFDTRTHVENVETMSIVSAPSLEHVMIAFTKLEYSLNNWAPMFRKLVTSLANVSSLELLHFDILRSLALAPPLPSSITFSQLTCLKFSLTVDEVADKRVYVTFSSLLRAMPILQELEVELLGSTSSKQAIVIKELLAMKCVGCACLDQTLTKVTITMFDWEVMNSIALSKFFLLNARVLERLEIWVTAAGEPQLTYEIEQVDKASSDAKVMINVNYKQRRDWKRPTFND